MALSLPMEEGVINKNEQANDSQELLSTESFGTSMSTGQTRLGPKGSDTFCKFGL